MITPRLWVCQGKGRSRPISPPRQAHTRHREAGSWAPHQANTQKRLAKTSICTNERSRRQATCARAFSLDSQKVRSRNGCGIMPPRIGRRLSLPQPKAIDLRESVQLRPAGGPFANWVRHHAAANWAQAQPAAAKGNRPARERSASTRRRSVRELGAASCRPGLDFFHRIGYNILDQQSLKGRCGQ